MDIFHNPAVQLASIFVMLMGTLVGFVKLMFPKLLDTMERRTTEQAKAFNEQILRMNGGIKDITAERQRITDEFIDCLQKINDSSITAFNSISEQLRKHNDTTVLLRESIVRSMGEIGAKIDTAAAAAAAAAAATAAERLRELDLKNQ